MKSEGRSISHRPLWRRRRTLWVAIGIGVLCVLCKFVGATSILDLIATMMAVTSFILSCWAFNKDVADEVIDFGDYFVVRRGDVTAYIGLDEIVAVQAITGTAKVRLCLSRDTRLGRRVEFYCNSHVISPSSIARRARELRLIAK